MIESPLLSIEQFDPSFSTDRTFNMQIWIMSNWETTRLFNAYGTIKYFASVQTVDSVPQPKLFEDGKIIAYFIYQSKISALIESAKNCPLNRRLNLSRWFPQISIIESLFSKLVICIYDAIRSFTWQNWFQRIHR